MSKKNIEVEFHYGNEDFDKLMKKIIFTKINQSIISKEKTKTNNVPTTFNRSKNGGE